MNTVKQLVETIKEGIQEKKGQDIVIADLTEIDGSIAKYFIICQGGSPTQVEAIAGSVGDIVRKNLKEKPVNVAGLGNDQWVAMDFVDVLVHIFFRKYVLITTSNIYGRMQSSPIYLISTSQSLPSYMMDQTLFFD